MTIPTAAKPTPVPDLDPNTAIVDPRTGIPTLAFLGWIQRLMAYDLAASRIIPCAASGANLITLTPNDAHPLIGGYWAYDMFPFEAAENSTGSVTMTVVPDSGVLSTLKAYVAGTQAGNGDVVAGRIYLAVYAPGFDSGAGGFVLK